MKMLKTILGLCTLSLAIGCASFRPVVDENAQYEKMGSTRAESEIDACMAKADQYLESHKKDRLLREAGRGAATGAVVGGIFGALSGNAGSALGGAAIGAGVGASSKAIGESTKDKLSPDQLKQNYVANCLKRKNLVVIGWK